jgi:hypothetical protein
LSTTAGCLAGGSRDAGTGARNALEYTYRQQRKQRKTVRKMRLRARRLIVALSWLLLIMLLVALGAWLYARFEQPWMAPESAALAQAFATLPRV